jgi:predicted metalloprotease
MFVLTIAGCLLVAACGSSNPGVNAAHSNAGATATNGADGSDTTSPDTSSETTTGETTEETSAETSPETTTEETSPETTTPDTESSGTDVSIPMDTMAPPSSVVDNPNNAPIDFGVNKTPQPYDDFLKASLADVQDFWRETYPAVYGATFPELTGGIWASYPDRAEVLPQGCGGTPDSGYIAQGNAFYCSQGDFIAYDDYDLIPNLVNEFGQSAVGVVFAHEFGHAIQSRVGVFNDSVPTVYWEQQADCFAGAWTAHVARGESARLTFGDQDIKAGLSAMVAVKDPLTGEDVLTSSNAHGNAFDRVGAFENGFKGGGAACKDMETNPLPLLDLPFSTEDEANSGGNLPYDQILPAVEEDLTRFWTASVASFTAPTITPYAHKGPFPSCEGIDESAYPFNAVYCAATNEIFFDEGYAKTLYKTYGDFAVGYIISDSWSEGVQTQIGSNLTGEQRLLVDDCLTGAWTRDTVPPEVIAPDDTRLYISPGDLDEAVETALLSDAGIGNGEMASAFEKIDYFRAGVLGGIDECNNRISGG